MLGLEQALAVVHTTMVATGRMTWQQVADAMSTKPAAIARLGSHGQGLVAGAPANITLFDPSVTVTVNKDDSKSLSRNNPWHGRTLEGAVVSTYLRGRRTFHNGEVQQ